jgi:hypothetical protein
MPSPDSNSDPAVQQADALLSEIMRIRITENSTICPTPFIKKVLRGFFLVWSECPDPTPPYRQMPLYSGTVDAHIVAGLYTPVMLTTAADVPFGAVMRHGVKSVRSAAESEHTPEKKLKNSGKISVKKKKKKK